MLFEVFFSLLNTVEMEGKFVLLFIDRSWLSESLNVLSSENKFPPSLIILVTPEGPVPLSNIGGGPTGNFFLANYFISL